MNLSCCFRMELENETLSKLFQKAEEIKAEKECELEEALGFIFADGADETDYTVQYPFEDETIFCHVFGSAPVESITTVLERYGKFSLIWATTDCQDSDVDDLFDEDDEPMLDDYDQDCCGYYRLKGKKAAFGIARDEDAQRMLLVYSWEDIFANLPDSPEVDSSDSFLIEYDEDDWEDSDEYDEYDDYDEYFYENYEFQHSVDEVIDEVIGLE